MSHIIIAKSATFFCEKKRSEPTLGKKAQASFLVHEKEAPIGWGAIEASKPLEANQNDVYKEKINKQCFFISIVPSFVRSLVDFPKQNNKQRLFIPTLNTMHTCVLTVTYLGGHLSACSVVWLFVPLFYLKLINVLMQLCKNFF